MAQPLFDSQVVTTVGVKPPATLTKWPEGGATASVGVAGGTPVAVVELIVWVDPAYKEKLASFTLPVPVGEDKAGDLFDSLPVSSIWKDWEWNVVSIGSSASLTLALQGVGV